MTYSSNFHIVLATQDPVVHSQSTSHTPIASPAVIRDDESVNATPVLATRFDLLAVGLGAPLDPERYMVEVVP